MNLSFNQLLIARLVLMQKLERQPEDCFGELIGLQISELVAERA